MNMLSHSFDDYNAHVEHLVRHFPLDVAMCKAIGCPDLEQFRITGDGQVAVLKHHGLKDGMSVYDLGCGSGRTAQALYRSGWKGHYRGADIIQKLVEYLNGQCPGYGAVVNRSLSIVAPDDSLDLVFHWASSLTCSSRNPTSSCRTRSGR